MDRPAGCLDELRTPPAPTGLGVPVSLELEREHPPGQPGRTGRKVLGRHRRLPAGYSGPRGCCVPTRAGRVARQGRVVETPVRLIRFEFTGYLPNREWTAYRGLPGRGVGPPRRGRQCLPRAGNRPRSSTPCQGRHTTGIPQGRPCRSGGGAQNRAFVLAHLLPPVMNMFPLPAWVAADDVLDGSGSRDPASSGRPPAELR